MRGEDLRRNADMREYPRLSRDDFIVVPNRDAIHQHRQTHPVDNSTSDNPIIKTAQKDHADRKLTPTPPTKSPITPPPPKPKDKQPAIQNHNSKAHQPKKSYQPDIRNINKTQTPPLNKNKKLLKTAIRTVLSNPKTPKVAQIPDTASIPKRANFLQRIYGKIKGASLRQILAVGLMAVILFSTGFVLYDSLKVNSKAKEILQETAKTEASKEVVDDNQIDKRQEQEGKDAKALPVNTIENYKVASTTPRVVYIDKIGSKGRLLPMGVNRDSSMQAPINIHDGGWYTGSMRPDQIGAVVLNGHATENNTGGGLFGKLYQLNIGDTVTVEVGDGKKYNYKVIHKEEVLENAVDMDKLMLPFGDILYGLNLITCAGSWTKDGKTLDKRLIIYTQRI